MARVHLTMSDEDRDRFANEARREGMTLSAWLRAAAHDRLEARRRARHLKSTEDLMRFFDECDARRGSEPEPDWEEVKEAMQRSLLEDLPRV